MKTKIVILKTAGQRLRESMVKWSPDSVNQHGDFEGAAKELGIQPLTKEVPDVPTDGELLIRATDNCSGHVFLTSEGDDIAAEFLRLLRERDGDKEPLEVTADDINLWCTTIRRGLHNDAFRQALAKAINAHRGVRPVPKVTAEMCKEACERGGSWNNSADYLNAKLAEAGKVGG